jgi:hypothetical protein
MAKESASLKVEGLVKKLEQLSVIRSGTGWEMVMAVG